MKFFFLILGLLFPTTLLVWKQEEVEKNAGSGRDENTERRVFFSRKTAENAIYMRAMRNNPPHVAGRNVLILDEEKIAEQIFPVMIKTATVVSCVILAVFLLL